MKIEGQWCPLHEHRDEAKTDVSQEDLREYLSGLLDDDQWQKLRVWCSKRDTGSGMVIEICLMGLEGTLGAEDLADVLEGSIKMDFGLPSELPDLIAGMKNLRGRIDTLIAEAEADLRELVDTED